MNNDSNSIIGSMIKGGLLGAVIGAFLTEDDEDGAIIIGALLGAAVSGTLAANNEAKKSNQPLLVAEKGKLYKVLPGGKKEFVKDLPVSTRTWPEKFNLK